MRHAVLALFLCLLVVPARADETEKPTFSKPPTLFIDKFQVKDAGGTISDVRSELLIGDRDNTELKFWFYLIGANFHSCSMSGRAKAVGANRYAVTEGSCELTITLDGETATLSDRDGHCKPLHCGTRAYIDDTRLFQSNN